MIKGTHSTGCIRHPVIIRRTRGALTHCCYHHWDPEIFVRKSLKCREIIRKWEATQTLDTNFYLHVAEVVFHGYNSQSLLSLIGEQKLHFVLGAFLCCNLWGGLELWTHQQREGTELCCELEHSSVRWIHGSSPLICIQFFIVETIILMVVI